MPRPAASALILLGLSALAPAAAAATVWAGADARTGGLAAHFGVAAFSIPFVGALGVEGSTERGYGGGTSLGAALTLRDLHIPFTGLDTFATAGLQFENSPLLYAETGLRGQILGPAGFRLSVRARQDGLIGAGAGLELRF